MKLVKIGMLVLAITFLAATFNNPVFSEEQTYEYKVVGIAEGETLKVMSKPDPKSEVVGELYIDSPCVMSYNEIVKHENTEWIKIFSAWSEGWVPLKNLKIVTQEECEGFSD